MIRSLSGQECRNAIARGDFDPPEGAAALILTQSWCPQWQAMKAYLPDAEKAGLNAGKDLLILYVEYDNGDFFEEFMKFKESVYDNREIPYVRYFQNGLFSSWSNYVSLDGFLHRLGLV